MPQRYRFDRYEVWPDERVLLVDGQPAALGARAFDVLLALIQRRDRLVTNDELLQVVWSGLLVNESELHRQISTLRSLLGTQAIATIAGRGYRFAMKFEGEPPELIAADVPPSPPASVVGTAQAGTDARPAAPTPGPRSTAPYSRKLAAILSADVVGYSRLMGEDDHATLEAIVATRSVMATHIESCGGRVVDATGDSLLAEFPSAVESVRSAMAIQVELARRNAPLPPSRRMLLRIGLNVGDVIEQAAALYGEGVNVAARLQALGEPGGVCISGSIFDQVDGKLPLEFRFAGEQAVKNIARPVRAYHVDARTPAAAKPTRPAMPTSPRGYRFGNSEVRPDQRLLLVDREPVKLGARAFDVLIALIERRDRMVRKNELLDLVWPGLIVEENTLQTQVSHLRKLLGPQAVQTIPGRGYRFVAALEGEKEPPTRPQPHPRTLDAPASEETPLPKFKTNLPATLPALVGREDDVAALGTLIAQHRLISIVGAGGMGKTLLALHLLQQRRLAYPHGVCWVEMASITDGALVPGSIAAALGVQIGSGDSRAGLLAAMAPLTLLVVLDNAEQVLADVSRLAGELHAAAPGVRLVVTNQAPLKVAAERVYRIGPLAVPQGPLPAAQALNLGAVALFTERAQAADSRFVLTDANAPAVIEVCRALDGLPLAIELAAARAPMLGVQRLASSMQDRLKLLTSSRNRAAPARQQTLRATLEWSHGFLDEREQAVFRRLGVIVGSASLELIRQVVADPQGEGDLDEWAVLDALGALVDRSFVVVLNTDDDPAAAPRYRLLESPRSFALERLAASGEHEVIGRRHALAMAALFDTAWDDCFSGRIGVDDWVHQRSFDLNNAREALAWAVAAGDAGSGLAIGATLLRALPWSLHAERMTLADRCEALIVPNAPERLQQRIWLQLSAQWANTQKQRSHGAAQRALGLARVLHAKERDPFSLYFSLCRFAFAASSVGEADAAMDALAELRMLEDPAWPPQRFYWGVAAEAHVAGFQGTAAEALRHTRRQVAVERARGASVSTGLSNLIHFELAAGDAAAAARTGTDLVVALEDTRNEHRLAYVRLNLTAAWLALDESEEARRVAQVGWPQAARFDLQPYWADYLALLAALDSRPQAAVRLLGYADAAYPAGEGREANEADAVERARTLARAALGEAEFARLHVEGATLCDADIAALAFGTQDA